MSRKSFDQAGFISPRQLVALTLCSFGGLLALISFANVPWKKPVTEAAGTAEERRERYMPVAGEKGEDLERLEMEWYNRVTYPTGRFDPSWVRRAAVEDARVRRSLPLGALAAAANFKGRGAGISSPTQTTTLDPTRFTALGPQPLRMTGCSGCYNYITTAGRVNDIVIDPTTTTNGSIVAYLASNGGGVWKTSNCCSSNTTWTGATDDPLLATITVDALTIDPNDHNTVYAGTGDLNYGSFSMGSQGILKSTDAGATWTLLGADVFGTSLFFEAGQFPQYQSVGKVRVDPRNSNNVVAGTKTGLYFSYDGGENWTGPCTTNNFTTQRQDITGLALTDTGTSTRIIAAVGVRGYATTVQYNIDQNGANGIYKGTMPASGCPNDFVSITSNDNGWMAPSALTGLNPSSGTPYGGANMGNQLGRIDIAVAPSNPDYIYAQVQSITPNENLGCGGANGCQLGAFRTSDGGVTWTLIPGSAGDLLTDCEGAPGDYPQNWYDQGLAVDPNNPGRAFFDTFEIWSWEDPSPIWHNITCGYGTINKGVHVDQHALAFVPGSSSILLAGNDGGVHGTTNADEAPFLGPTWFNMDNGLNTIEFYSGDISGNFSTSPNPQANGGAQDNGSSSVLFSGTPSGPVQWQTGKGGDGFYARIDPVGTGSSLRLWQGNNSGHLHRCTSNCSASGASWSDRTGGWTGDIQSFILPFDLFHGGIAGGDDCDPAGATTGCGRLVAGTRRVWETITGAASTVSWYVNSPELVKPAYPLGNRSHINQVKYSPKYHSVAIVGTNDGNVQIGFGLGAGVANSATWVNVTANNVVLPNRPVLGIALDPTVGAANTPIGYAAVGGFNENTPATPGHVFRVSCNANCTTPTWQNKSGNLPNIPVDSIIVNPNLPQQVFAGTDWGLYYTDDITAASPIWYRFDNGLPHAMIWDMQIDRGSTTLSVWTRGRGAYVWPLPTSPIAPALKILSITTSGNGALLDCLGVPNAINRVEATNDLMAPNSFTTIGTPTAGSTGAFQFNDPNPPDPERRFYRLSYP